MDEPWEQRAVPFGLSSKAAGGPGRRRLTAAVKFTAFEGHETGRAGRVGGGERGRPAGNSLVLQLLFVRSQRGLFLERSHFINYLPSGRPNAENQMEIKEWTEKTKRRSESCGWRRLGYLTHLPLSS